MSDVTAEEIREIIRDAGSGDETPDINSQTQVDAWRAERLAPEMS